MNRAPDRVSPEQYRHARRLLDWDEVRAANEAGIPLHTLRDLEGDTATARLRLVLTYNRQGIEFARRIGSFGIRYVVLHDGEEIFTAADGRHSGRFGFMRSGVRRLHFCHGDTHD